MDGVVAIVAMSLYGRENICAKSRRFVLLFVEMVGRGERRLAKSWNSGGNRLYADVLFDNAEVVMAGGP
jgi:hypothetical protein